MKIYEVRDAEKKRLMQLTVWVKNEPKEYTFIKKCYNSVIDDVLVKREAMVVQKGGLLALYVNRVAK